MNAQSYVLKRFWNLVKVQTVQLFCVCLQLYKLQSALRKAGVTMYGGERASHALSIERAKSDRQAVSASTLCFCCGFWLQEC